MTTTKNRNEGRREKALLDTDITTARLDRRSFLTRVAGAGTLAAGTALSVGCADRCDSDTVTDNDRGPYADPIDRPRDRTCDSDGY